MLEHGELTRRFVAGSNGLYLTTLDWRNFFVGMPQSLRQANELNRLSVATQREALAHLREAHSQNIMALNEISDQLSCLQSTVSSGFDQLSDAVFHLENSLCVELFEVKLVLGQIDSKLGELVHLVKFPRETEARELVEDGIKALATGNLDDAEYCLTKAVEIKRTSFQGHLNLAFAFLRKDDADHAIEHFKKAADYSSGTDGADDQIMALEILARAYFASKNFGAARSTMERVLDLRSRHGKPSSHSEYQYATYCAQLQDECTTREVVMRLCKEKPTYFANAATDEDFAPVRSQLMEVLNDLAAAEHQKGCDLLESAGKALTESIKSMLATKKGGKWCRVQGETDNVPRFEKKFAEPDSEIVAPEINALREGLDAIRTWLEARTYTNSLQAVAACKSILAVTPYLPEWSRLRKESAAAQLRKRQCEETLATARRENERNKAGLARRAKLAESMYSKGEKVGGVLGTVFVLFVTFMYMTHDDIGGGILALFFGFFFVVLLAGLFALLAKFIGLFINPGVASGWKDIPALKSAEVTYSEAVALATRLSNELSSMEKRCVREIIKMKFPKQPEIEAFKEAIHLNPGDAVAHFHLGNAYSELGRHQDAIDAYKEAVRLKPDDAKVNLKLGVSYWELNFRQEAVDAFKEAIRLDPDSAYAHRSLGYSYSELNRHQDAVNAFKEAIRLDPDSVYAHYNLGYSCSSLYHHQDAINAYKEAIRLKPDYAYAHYNLGLSYLGIKDKDSALEQYKILENLNPDLANKLFNEISK